jgi:hypothetical protein
MKLAFVTVLAIALLPRYALAAGEAKLFASFTSNPVPRWTQPGSQVIADLGSPETGTPDGRRTPGGTRPELSEACKPTDKPLTALVPGNGKGLTTAEYPVFWFYIPYAPEEIHSIEFSLHDRNETTTLYSTSVQLTQTPGVIGISLSQSPEYDLKVNESYHWYFTVKCQPKETSEEDDIVLDGWVTRVEQGSNLVLWYDKLTNLAKRYLSEPQNPEVKKAWAELMQYGELEWLTNKQPTQLVNDSKK